eukprot:CAMPEP_0194530842 /NCGR_PEP_ID=MMETSP0253-20130528/67946_1 /TAXON_ID=2966 /ORGANISM="Noctiluca scintillans" /LENGTH=294 /DNA_ID=CAMNT_0039376129 /DNA_START=30 /DNA_END=914 /DNA_ORIENTATION=-
MRCPERAAEEKAALADFDTCALVKYSNTDVNRVFSLAEVAANREELTVLLKALRAHARAVLESQGASGQGSRTFTIPLTGQARQLCVDGKRNGPFGTSTNFDFENGKVDFVQGCLRFECRSTGQMRTSAPVSLWSPLSRRERRLEHIVNCIRDARIAFPADTAMEHMATPIRGHKLAAEEVAERLLDEFGGEMERDEEQEKEGDDAADDPHTVVERRDVGSRHASSHSQNFYVRVKLPNSGRSVKLFRDPSTDCKGSVCLGCDTLGRAVRCRIYCEVYRRMYELQGTAGTQHDI